MENSKYLLYLRGGSISQKRGIFFRGLNVSLIGIYIDEDLIKSEVKIKNETLTPGEKSYYKLRYCKAKLTENEFLKLKNNI